VLFVSLEFKHEWMSLSILIANIIVSIAFYGLKVMQKILVELKTLKVSPCQAMTILGMEWSV
jgi:hypothetical protein